MYQPKPIDTSGVTLPPEIVQLTEKLAIQVHELWSRQRIADGWTHGPHRDDVKKQHPNLVPYEELADADREYDRITALGTIKTILALGYTIAKK
ncbi:MAG: Ryanodine receptor Ryr [Elusimicrobia bacterium]|nr:Ryanodine receptor Ryr [Elusimicrobiota bacterium]